MYAPGPDFLQGGWVSKIRPRYFCSKLFTNRTKSLVSVSWPVTVSLVCGHSRAFSGPAPDRRTEGSKEWVLIGCDYFCVSSLSIRPSIHPHTYTCACTGYVFMSNLYSNRLEKSSTLSSFLSALLLPTWLSQGICRSQLCTYPTVLPVYSLWPQLFQWGVDLCILW